MNEEWKYVVWVGACDDYYVDYEQAKKHYDEWIDKGYDDVHLQALSDVKRKDNLYILEETKEDV